MKELLDSSGPCGPSRSASRRASKLEPPRIGRQQRIQFNSIENAGDEGADSTQRITLKLSPLSPTPSESSSCSSLSSPVPSSKKFLRKEKIGQGAQGSVYRCIEVSTGREVASKVIMTHELSPGELEAIKREVKTIKRLHHRHLVEYYKATEKKSKQLIIYMEYVAGGSLSSKLRHDGALPIALAKKYTRQLCEALRCLHQNRIAHRDIKCANIFLTSNGDDIKLGDFGAFKEIGSISLVGGIKGTPHWMAPEVIREQQTSEDGWLKADIWSLGCAVIEMLTGHSPWQQYSNPLAAMYQIVSSDNIPTIPENATEETSSFLKLCLQRSPDDRAMITQLLKHAFLQFPTSPKRTLNERAEQDSTNKTSNNEPMVRQEHQPSNHCAQDRQSAVKESETGSVSVAAAVPKPSKVETRTTKSSPTDPPAKRTQTSDTTHCASLSPELPPSAVRTLRRPSQIARLKPIEGIKAPSNQDSDDHRTGRSTLSSRALTTGISRGVSAGTLSHLPPIDKATKPDSNGTIINPVRLRRVSTAPAPARDPEEIMNTTQTVTKLKLPPLSARTAGIS